MSGILRRTAFMEVDKRSPGDGTFHRPHDWARVTTGIGTMAEPFCMFTRHVVSVGNQQTDWTEPMSRVDDIELIDFDKNQSLVGDNVHGGILIPRTGR